MEKFIITDPCYIMGSEAYDAVGESLGWGNFTEMRVPAEFVRKGSSGMNREGRKTITIHHIEGTPNGDGSMTYNGQDIGVDAGMLCIAESKDGWEGESFGATFPTLEAAREALPKILKHF